jgi:hypothetical protein
MTNSLARFKQNQLQQKIDLQTHQYNMDGLNGLYQAMQYMWVKCGRPKTTNENEEFKHFWIWITGLIQRLWEIIILKKV